MRLYLDPDGWSYAQRQDAVALLRPGPSHHPHRPAARQLGTVRNRRWVPQVPGGHVPITTCMSHDEPRWSGPGHLLAGGRAAARPG